MRCGIICGRMGMRGGCLGYMMGKIWLGRVFWEGVEDWGRAVACGGRWLWLLTKMDDVSCIRLLWCEKRSR